MLHRISSAVCLLVSRDQLCNCRSVILGFRFPDNKLNMLIYDNTAVRFKLSAGVDAFSFQDRQVDTRQGERAAVSGVVWSRLWECEITGCNSIGYTR